ncbi:medium chain dehydrogenase/reductase family protein [Paenibacillus silviterrae]|uniref:medium chain dehydrogenase/reductase family protein n=1 Tax=Paenibacillus silviterrae TaxID=3242194 RepID=UPI002543D94D|nr:medium chain dehydrogenase/reductase family protein [Paenibacillus chinjuensis]
MENRRIIVSEYGGPEVVKLIEEPLRLPGPGEIRVRMLSAGVALADVMRREGVYPASPEPPFTPGYDVVGIVDARGEGVEQMAEGERVGLLFPGTGGYAAYVYAPAEEAVKVPESVDPAQAAAVLLNYVTAYQMLHRVAKVSQGDHILIHGAAGGVGSALLELGRLAELTMYGTASAAKHPVVAAYGASPIDYRTEDFVDLIQSRVPGGVDAVFDPIGGDNWQRSMQTLKRGGRFVGYGYTSSLGEATQEDWIRDWKLLSNRQQTSDGPEVFMYSITTLKQQRPNWYHEDATRLLSLLENRTLQPIISHRVPLSEAARAQQLLHNTGTVGKVILTGL